MDVTKVQLGYDGLHVVYDFINWAFISGAVNVFNCYFSVIG